MSVWLRIVPFVAAAASLPNAGCDSAVALQGDGGEAEASLPPVADIVVGGWRDSDAPWTPPAGVDSCANFNWTFFDVIPADDALYASWAWTVFEPLVAGPSDFLYGVVLRNSGSGWAEYFRSECSLEGGTDLGCQTTVERLLGTSSGGLVVRTWGDANHALGVLDTSGVVLWPEEIWDVSDPFIVNDYLAYAVLGGTDSKVIRFDGAMWTPVADVLPDDLPYQLVWQLWADEDDLWVAGDRGTVLSLGDPGWQVHALPTLDPITALWGSDGDDIWVADRGRDLFHWDGGTWQTVLWPNLALEGGDACGEPSYIQGIWGTEGVLFFHTGRQFTRRDPSGEFTALGYWPATAAEGAECIGGLRITRLRGTSATDVFLAAVEPSARDRILEPGDDGENCASRPLVLLWDGASFRWI